MSTRDSQRREADEPTGLLPKNIQFYVFGGIAVVIIVASFFSGERVKAPTSEALRSGPSPSQLSTFQALLKDADRSVSRTNESIARLQTKAQQPPPQRAAQPADPFREKQSAREAEGPFASNFVIRRAESEQLVPDRSPLVVVRNNDDGIDQEAPVSNDSTLTTPPKPSGELLPPRIGDLFRLYEGSIVATALMNRLDGSFTGPVQCVVITDVSSQDGTAVLIPAGSKFLGKAVQVQEQNQTRLAVSFERLIMPNGYSISLDSAPGLDRNGETGLKDKVDNHRRRTFTVSGAMGLLGGLALYAGGGGPFAAGVANRLGGSASQSMAQLLNALPTITIREGHPVAVYLPEDLLLPRYVRQ